MSPVVKFLVVTLLIIVSGFYIKIYSDHSIASAVSQQLVPEMGYINALVAEWTADSHPNYGEYTTEFEQNFGLFKVESVCKIVIIDGHAYLPINNPCFSSIE